MQADEDVVSLFPDITPSYMHLRLCWNTDVHVKSLFFLPALAFAVLIITLTFMPLFYWLTLKDNANMFGFRVKLPEITVALSWLSLEMLKSDYRACPRTFFHAVSRIVVTFHVSFIYLISKFSSVIRYLIMHARLCILVSKSLRTSQTA